MYPALILPHNLHVCPKWQKLRKISFLFSRTVKNNLDHVQMHVFSNYSSWPHNWMNLTENEKKNKGDRYKKGIS